MNVLEDIKLNSEEELQLREQLECWKLKITKILIEELEVERIYMDIFSIALDDLFLKKGIRFIPTQERLLSRDIKIAKVDKSIMNTQYWREFCKYDKIYLAYKPVKMLIRIRKYLAMKSCGAYEKIKIRGKE